jgi:hypothetical protein
MSRHFAPRSRALFSAAVLLIGLGGCRDTPPPFVVKESLARQLPGARFQLEFHLRLGRLALGLSRRILAWTGESGEEAYALLAPLQHVEVAGYRVEDLPPESDLRRIELANALRLKRAGWETALYAADGASRTWVFQRSSPRGALTHLFVVALDDEELTLVSVEGSIDKLLAEEIGGQPGPFARLVAG